MRAAGDKSISASAGSPETPEKISRKDFAVTGGTDTTTGPRGMGPTLMDMFDRSKAKVRTAAKRTGLVRRLQFTLSGPGGVAGGECQMPHGQWIGQRDVQCQRLRLPRPGTAKPSGGRRRMRAPGPRQPVWTAIGAIVASTNRRRPAGAGNASTATSWNGSSGTGSFSFSDRGPLNPQLGRDEIAHRLLRLDPRAARLTPARTVEQRDIDTHTPPFADRMLDQLPPGLAQHFHIAGRVSSKKTLPIRASPMPA